MPRRRGRKAPLPLPAQMLFDVTSRAGLDPLGRTGLCDNGNVNANAPFASIEVRMVPETSPMRRAAPAPMAVGSSASCWFATAKRSRIFCAQRGREGRDRRHVRGVRR